VRGIGILGSPHYGRRSRFLNATGSRCRSVPAKLTHRQGGMTPSVHACGEFLFAAAIRFRRRPECPAGIGLACRSVRRRIMCPTGGKAVSAPHMTQRGSVLGQHPTGVNRTTLWLMRRPTEGHRPGRAHPRTPSPPPLDGIEGCQKRGHRPLVVAQRSALDPSSCCRGLPSGVMALGGRPRCDTGNGHGARETPWCLI
jgi:hypothetical protein